MPFIKKRDIKPEHILVCRPDAVGDVVLTMPLCGIIKEYYPYSKISLLGRTYTKDVASCCQHIDGFINVDDWNGKSEDEISNSLKKNAIDTVLLLPASKYLAVIMRRAAIQWRVGTANRLFHWFLCNKLVPLSRRSSGLHESQLHLKLLRGIGINEFKDLNELYAYYGFTKVPELQAEYASLLSKDKFNLIIHPKSGGNAPEWTLQQFSELLSLLDKTKFNVLVSGSKEERKQLASWLNQHKDDVTDIAGLFPLNQFIAFINKADGLLASSTGPVHIAAACGIHSLGLYCTSKFKNSDRWAPVGKQAEHLDSRGDDLSTISPQMVFNRISNWIKA